MAGVVEWFGSCGWTSLSESGNKKVIPKLAVVSIRDDFFIDRLLIAAENEWQAVAVAAYDDYF